MKKITVVGSGHVGANVAFLCAQKGLGHVILLDILEGIPQGKALDIHQSSSVFNSSSHVQGTNSYRDTQDSDMVIITAGVARRPGMSREDLLKTNAKIVQDVVRQILEHSSSPILIMVTNPLDVMTYHAWKISGLPSRRVMGQAGILDSARFRCFLSETLDVSPLDIHTLVLGGHGDTMVPLLRYTTVSGVPVSEFLDQKVLDRLIQRTQKGGGEIVSLLKTGSAYYAPAASVVEMIEAIIMNQRRVLPCSAYLDGEYGIKDLYMGVPIKLGEGGVEHIYELKLKDDELGKLHRSADIYRENLKVLYPRST